MVTLAGRGPYLICKVGHSCALERVDRVCCIAAAPFRHPDRVAGAWSPASSYARHSPRARPRAERRAVAVVIGTLVLTDALEKDLELNPELDICGQGHPLWGAFSGR